MLKMNGLTEGEEKLDELVYLSDSDPELKEALVWVDKQALEKGISMLDMCELILNKVVSRKDARDWVQSLQKNRPN